MSPRNQAALRQEAAAVTCLFLGAVLLLSLISYSLPLLGQPPLPQLPAENWCGHFGYYTARYLLSFFGLISFFPPLLLFYLAAAVLSARAVFDRLPFIVAGLSGVLLAASGLLAWAEHIIFPPDFILPGGFLGSLIRGLLEGVLGTVGSALLLLLLLLFSLMAAIRFSPLAVAAWTWDQTTAAAKTAADRALTAQEKLADWKAEREQRKALPPPPQAEETVKILPGLSMIVQKLPFIREPVKAEPATVPPKPEQPEKEEQAPEPQPRKKPVVWHDFQLPPISLLEENTQEDIEIDRQHYYEVSEILVAKLLDFAVQGEVIGVSPGPVVTTYEFAPAAGIKINKIVNLADDLAMVLKVDRVRVVGSIPGKAAIGIEIPNPKRKTVFLRDILLDGAYQKSSSFLTIALGVDVIGQPTVANLARMPHLLIAGATGAGKSVAINAFICSILYKATPDMVRLLMIDPKRIELSTYEGIPHLLHPVVVEPKMASRALLWAVREMERRYKLLEAARVKSFATYNETAEEKLPYIVIIVDELADLMMVASKDVETSIARLAQMARAAGMHIILATQRPSVDVLTGLIKANFPTRISFKVSSKVDSRTILDSSGAEHLLGAGDMLFLPPGAAKLRRIHGAFISEEETERIINFLKEQGSADYDESMLKIAEEDAESGEEDEEDYDEFYDQAVAVVKETRQASISMLQRKLRVGYNRAARMIEMMERDGIVGPSDGSRPREVLVPIE
ncbi:MAG: DNA translocase FtsK 4TM domain-containing protein [Candidatus Electronema sp. V4]|uniref:DNA translocase FtsK 4TM domain-containing protein n=1 Tax=Candidatus Electronema sp. V4 TaxID=3454756 RepID=UPI0040555746